MTLQNTISLIDWTVILANRGLDDLISEYEASSDEGRRSRLEDFFRLCTPVQAPPAPNDRFVRIASDNDLRNSGRLTTLRPASDEAFELMGQVVPEPEIQLIDLRNSTILPDQSVLADNLYITHQIRHSSAIWLQSGEGHYLDYLSDLNRGSSTARLSLPEGAIRLPDSATYFLFQAIVGSQSFGHFIIDMLTQLIVYDQLRVNYGGSLVPVIVSPLPHTFRWPGMTWLFDGLVGSHKDVVHLQPGARLELARGFTSNRLAHFGAGGVSTRAFSYLRSVLFARFSVSANQIPYKRVYISRRDAGYREADNIQDVEHLLAQYGFQTVVIQDITPQEAFDALHDAEIIVGMHGSGLMYHLYTERPATLIELSYPGFEWPIILACARACGHTAVRIGYQDWNIDVASLKTTLEDLAGPL